MYQVNVLLYARGEDGWKFLPVRKDPRGKFLWDNAEKGVYYLEWYEDKKRKRQRAGIRPSEILEARRRKIFELKGKATDGGRSIRYAPTGEDSPVPITATTESFLNHVKVN